MDQSEQQVHRGKETLVDISDNNERIIDFSNTTHTVVSEVDLMKDRSKEFVLMDVSSCRSDPLSNCMSISSVATEDSDFWEKNRITPLIWNSPGGNTAELNDSVVTYSGASDSSVKSWNNEQDITCDVQNFVGDRQYLTRRTEDSEIGAEGSESSLHFSEKVEDVNESKCVDAVKGKSKCMAKSWNGKKIPGKENAAPRKSDIRSFTEADSGDGLLRTFRKLCVSSK